MHFFLVINPILICIIPKNPHFYRGLFWGAAPVEMKKALRYVKERPGRTLNVIYKS